MASQQQEQEELRRELEALKLRVLGLEQRLQQPTQDRSSEASSSDASSTGAAHGTPARHGGSGAASAAAAATKLFGRTPPAAAAAQAAPGAAAPQPGAVPMAATRVVMHQIVMPAEVDALGICFGGQVGLYACRGAHPCSSSGARQGRGRGPGPGRLAL
jgi:hypothetical protein